MYHQFKELADIDITKEPMEVGPTTHYIMGGVRVDGDTQMSTRARAVRRGECAGGINGANRLGGNSLSDLLVFGKRAGEYAARVREGARRAAVDEAQVDARGAPALAPFERAPAARGPYQVQHDCRT
jgi:succinate dehydrogenase / fumarate reductase flavoprotein subunit